MEVRGKRLQVIAEFIAAIEVGKILFGRGLGCPLAEAGKLRRVLGGGGDKIRSLIPPAAAHRMTLLETDHVCRWIAVEKVLERDQSAAARADHGDLHAACS